MLPRELEKYLHDHIPLSGAMAVSVQSVSQDSVILTAPLAPNINHRDTVFGGSMSSLAMLAAWSLLFTRMRGEGLSARLVIQRNNMEFRQPIAGPFMARSELEHPEKWAEFKRLFARRGKSRISVASVLEHQGEVAGRFSGEFVALALDGTD